ncbi:alpha-2-macroglobulin [Sphingopyxis sp. DHUNG17]|uniref:alpha-2-macroglobulin family protein n=1 Tax=Sphingopyxis jiangsuensis TaxID=2871171 RepID=UPI00191F9AD9|nr:MG2 domain-containing protein [Sphingopyxis lutea]MBL0769227.1 alpha-2-macroglobulin [Sphingopyxis lutea]
MTRAWRTLAGRLTARARLALLVPLGLAMAATAADTVPQVTLATPGSAGSGDGAITRFTLRFSEEMVALGDPRARAPATHDCKVGSSARWVDTRTWVLAFDKPLPGGLRCHVELRGDLATLRGLRVVGHDSFEIDTGGPSARAVLVGGHYDGIEEDQIFLVATNVAADRASVGRFAYCAVDGIGEKIPVDVLPRDTAAQILTGLGDNSWRAQSFARNASLPLRLPAAGADRDAALDRVVPLKCRRPLPPGREMALVWDARIAQQGVPGRTAGRDQRFDYDVRPAFTARMSCSRVNPQAGCNPINDVVLNFAAPVARDTALAATLSTADGQRIAARANDDDRHDPWLTQVRFAGPLPRDVDATLVLPADVTDQSGRPLSNRSNFPLAFRIDRAPPLVKFAAPFGILEASEGGMLPVTVRGVEGSMAEARLAMPATALRVGDDDAAIARWLRRVDDAGGSDYREERDATGKEVRVNYTGTRSVFDGAPAGGERRDLRLMPPGGGKAFEVVGIPLGHKGFHVVEIASPELGAALLGRKATRYVASAALVTNMAVHFKWGRENSLAWVTALDTGKPVAGADIRIVDSCTGRLLARGTADKAGRLAFPAGLPEPETYANCEDEPDPTNSEGHALMVTARSGDDFSFTLTDWGSGIRPYDFDMPFGWSERGDILHTIFDRALVKAGETVNMKHVLRRPVGLGFKAPEPMAGKLRLVHRGSDTEFELPFAITAAGSGETVWNVPKSAPMGDYDLVFVTKDRQDKRDRGDDEEREKTIWSNQSIRVDEYRLPTMKATVTGPKAALVRPASVPLSLFVGYLSGGPAPNLPVELRATFRPGWSPPEDYREWSFDGRPVKEGVVKLDDDGEEPGADAPLARALPLVLGADGTASASIAVDRPIAEPTAMAVEMDYEDANGETLTASRRITLYPAAVRLGMKTDGWMMRDTDLRLDFVALDLDGKPIRGQRVAVALYSRAIITARRRLIGGFYAYDNQMRTTKLSADCSATTDRLGRASCAMAPGVSGEVTVVATTQDADGNEARAVRSVWLAGDDDWWFGGDNGDRMDVIAEKPRYAAGDTATFQVRMPFREATALVTVEREGVLSSFVTTLKGTNPVVRVKLPATYAPDVYVSVMAVRGRVTGQESWFRKMKRAVGFRIETSEGAPPTALVDLAKPAYRMGVARIKVGWEGHRLGVEVRTDKQVYAVRDTAKASIAVKTPDGKPPRQADVAFVAVDEALLQLAPNESWALLDAMMGERTLDVLTSTAQMQVVGKRHYGRKALEPGGGGGGDLSGLTREDFRPVLLWRGTVPLDAKGRASVDVPLSDNLSGFRLVAVATDGAQYFGTGETSIRTVQDLAVFAGLPELVRSGDTYDARFTLRNGTDRAMTVTANAALSPAVATAPPLTVTIPAGGAVPISWSMQAPATAGPLTWTVEAASADGRQRDRLVFAQQVEPAVPVETWAASLLRVGPSTTLPIAIPAGALPGGHVDIALAGTLAPPLAGVRDYMAAYPYTCFEQTTSRAIALGDVGRWQTLAEAMPTYLDRDGLLRYWPNERLDGSAELTAYVMAVTAANGFAVPEASKDKMVKALQAIVEGRLSRRGYGPYDVRPVRVAALAALARNKASSPALVAAIDLTPAEMTTGTLADWLVAIERTPGVRNAAALRTAAEAELRKRLVFEGTRLDLADNARAPWWMMTSGDEMAIKALEAVLGRKGWEDDAGKLMVGVAQRQRRGRWDTTPANAWGAVTVRRFASLYPASAIGGVTTASLAGAGAEQRWPLPADAAPLRLPLAAATMALAHQGGGSPWATVSVKAAVPLREPLNAGYRIKRAVSIVKAANRAQLTRGDVIKIRIEVTAEAGRTWVVISDPVPPGATILGNLGGQSEMLAGDAGGSGWQPSYVERGRDSWRGYFGWMPAGTHAVEYVVRLNGSGRFTLPPTRVEAMYSPAIRGQLPNAPMTVAASAE